MTDAALVRRLGDFIAFERSLRLADSLDALDRIACNDLSTLIDCTTVLRVAPHGRGLRAATRGRLAVRAVAGVSDFDADAPLIRAAHRWANDPLRSTASAERDAAGPFSDLGFDALLAVPVGDAGYLLVLRARPVRDEERRIAAEAAAAVAHAERALHGTRRTARTSASPSPDRPVARWAKRAAVAAALGALAALPIRQSVMAEAEVVAARPVVVAAPIDGVVRALAVRPNERVERGQLLVSLDDSDLTHRRARLQAELDLLDERRREAAQSTLERAALGGRLAEIDAEIDLKRLDLDIVEQRLDDIAIRAEADGIAVYAREADWLGRAVRTGDRIMEIAVDGSRRFEAWVAVNDAIRLDAGSEATFFPDAFPLETSAGEVDSVSFFATRGTDDRLAYRVTARSSEKNGLRLGMKGSVRLYGERVALGYALFRKPAAATRRAIGF